MRIIFCILFISYVVSSQNVTNDYIQQYKEIAIDEMERYNIPASITLAQAILESGSGRSKLAVDANNHFGIKCHVDWKGLKTFHDDDEKNECFRSYNNPFDSFRDHSIFLSERKRYSFLFDLRKNDYQGWAKGLQKAGYATSKTYSKKLIKLIKDYNLSQYDDVRSSKSNQKANYVNNQINRQKENNFIKYILAKEGQMYDDIAEDQGVWLWELLKYNESPNDRLLTEGEKVYLQPKRRKGMERHHIVDEGETMYSISQFHGIQLKHLYKKNKMDFGDEPYVGQKLNLIKKIKLN